jgi:hypothetical protein
MVEISAQYAASAREPRVHLKLALALRGGEFDTADPAVPVRV